MSGITFGSVGDIIAVGQIAWALSQALTNSRGSAKVYQGLVRELETFDQALLQVVALWQNYQESPELIELGDITRNAVRDWKDILLEFRLKVDKKYGTSLAPGGSGNWVKDASKKFLWLSEKDDVMELRRKLQTGSDAITMLCLAAMGKSSKLDHNAQAVRVELVHGLLQESIKRAEEQMNILKVMDEKLDSQSQKSDMILTTVKSNFATQIPSIAINMKSLLSLLQSHIISQQVTPRGIGTTWQQAPVTLEDALGFMIPIPLELVNSWDMFDMIIAKRFEKHKSHSKILRGEYAIEEDTTGREVSRESDWSMCLRPGQKIDMSMVFSEINESSNHCPRCQTKSPASLEERTQCVNKGCGMWFTRIAEAEEELDEEPEPIKTSVPRSNEPGEKTPKKAGPIVRPSDFQRVRLLRKSVIMEKMQEATSSSGNADVNGDTSANAPYQERLKADLERAGMNNEEIAAILEKDRTLRTEDVERPTYTRLARRHLSVETLNTYRLDYEIDKDPNYVIVKRWVPEYEQDFLWNHTREIRTKRTQPRRSVPREKETAEERLNRNLNEIEELGKARGGRYDTIEDEAEDIMFGRRARRRGGTVIKFDEEGSWHYGY